MMTRTPLLLAALLARRRAGGAGRAAREPPPPGRSCSRRWFAAARSPRMRRGCNASTTPPRRSRRRPRGATSSWSTAHRSARAGAGCSASLCRGCPIFGGGDESEDEDRIEPVESVVASASQNGHGQWVVALQDGGVWKQADNNPLALRPRTGQPVVITRAAMGSFMMRVNNQPGIRARRIR